MSPPSAAQPGPTTATDTATGTAAGPGPDWAAIRAEFRLPVGFPPDVLCEAEQAAARQPDRTGRVEALDVELVTVDPPGSRDLDQALGIETRPGGFRVHYAIADLGAVVAPGGPLDAEVRRRGQTVYLPDGSVPLHPPVLSEGAASLLPGQVRAAVLWTVELDGAGEVRGVDVRRALVRSRAQWDYQGAQDAVDAGTLPDALRTLPEVGRARRALAVARGAIELELPEQEVVPDGAGGWRPAIRAKLDVEDWNAEISLLTGMCAAELMLEGRIGVLRTLPPPAPDAVAGLRRTARRLGLDWPESATVAQALSALDRSTPEALALLRAATRLLRGAGYHAFAGSVPEQTGHAGIGAPYAHVTAPLRRLVDRFGTEVCLAVAAGREVPEWLRATLPELPGLMADSDALAGKVDRACVDAAEVAVLAGREGQEFEALVLRAPDPGAGNDEPGEVYVLDPPVLARCTGRLTTGDRTGVRLVAADPVTRRVSFAAP